ncbi:hypothetical protein, variant 3 [Cladophialophora immunda]|uniref:Uncharacterized protein n=1 Tax=Cladophialophora immunda TaxID=569365 RepID=A0A0D2CI53_9EURO|nr:hypothetical protein, variant 2 [Cladophialophora immunda]XP_016251035.1 hypothetical protein, variant 3 [Cladophialophora immunda]KIW30818.1 hypothetical protein, variant 2 [Cladophialophora immunda]KIW30819.1 hypothetical protein, variant 3 [Cladophialophora immunda]
MSFSKTSAADDGGLCAGASPSQASSSSRPHYPRPSISSHTPGRKRGHASTCWWIKPSGSPSHETPPQPVIGGRPPVRNVRGRGKGSIRKKNSMQRHGQTGLRSHSEQVPQWREVMHVVQGPEARKCPSRAKKRLLTQVLPSLEFPTKAKTVL